ncbi:MAG: hypothetical protein JWM78_2504 [Verrucomicrobiaceae bacterium]|nr:hypothetical protein [Verrucomicrobiaceae bacterium]
MASAQFNVAVDGQLLPGFDYDTVLAQLQQQLKLPEAKARQLVAGNIVIIKRSVAAEVADAYCKRLMKIGLNAQRVALPLSASIPVPASTSANAESVTAIPKSSTVKTIDYFSGIATPLPTAGNRIGYLRALYGAFFRGIGIVAAYTAVVLLATIITLFYIIHFGYLLVAPPVVFSATVFLLPLLALLLLLALLYRPFLPIKSKQPDWVSVDRSDQPQLFLFVERLCAALAIKPPQTIALNSRPAITIARARGFKQFWRGDYQLTLGLPLLDASSVTQFGGILAAQLRTQAIPSGLRYLTLLQSIQAQLCGCMSGDDWLYRRVMHLSLRWNKIVRLVQIILEQSNRFLQKFLLRSDAAHLKFQRNLILEQDRYLALLAGSSALPSVLLLQEKLITAAGDAIAKNTEDRIDSGLVDNLPALIRHYFESIDEKFEHDTRRRWNNETTSRRGDAATSRERIEQLAPQTPLLEITDTASTLLENFAAVASAATQQTYRAADIEFNADNLLPADSLTYIATQDIVQRQQADVYFNNWLKPFRFWTLANYQLIRDMPLQDAAAQLSVCVNEIRRLTPDRFKLLGEYERLQNQILEISLAQHVLAAGKKFSFRYMSYDGVPLQPVLEERQQQLNAVMEKLALQETVMGGRITLGLRLSGQSEKDISDLHDAMRLIQDSGTRLYKLSLDAYQLENLLERHRLREADYSAPIKRLEEKMRDATTLLLTRLNDIPCPLDARYRSLKIYVETALQKPSAHLSTSVSLNKSRVLQQTRRLLDVLYVINEKLSLLAADYGTIAEEAYRIEPIKLVTTAK